MGLVPLFPGPTRESHRAGFGKTRLGRISGGLPFRRRREDHDDEPSTVRLLVRGFAAGEDTAAAGGLEPSYSIEVNDAGGNYCFDCRPFFGESNTFTNGPQPLVTYEGNYYTSADVCAGLHTGCMVESRNTMK